MLTMMPLHNVYFLNESWLLFSSFRGPTGRRPRLHRLILGGLFFSVAYP